jgi:hypothetical protein
MKNDCLLETKDQVEKFNEWLKGYIWPKDLIFK